MKKFLTTFASVGLALSMVLSFAGCGSKEEDASSDGNSRVEGNAGDDSSSGKLLGNSNKLFASVQEYIDAQKDEIDEAIKQNEDSGMSMEVTADGDTLIYRYVYNTAIPVTQAVVDTFNSSLDTYKTQFNAILSEMERVIDVKEPAVKLLYENPDGSLVYSCVFTKDGVEVKGGDLVSSDTKMFASVQEYLDAQADQIEEAKKQIEGSGMSMEIAADGETLIYRYIYDTAVEVNDELTASFDASLDQFKTQFDAILAEMEQLIDIAEPAVKLSYENPDGSVIYTHTFTK